jgi:hypothetical protein
MLPIIFAIVAAILGYFFLKRWQGGQTKGSDIPRDVQGSQPRNNTNEKQADGPFIGKVSDMKNGEYAF